MATKNKIPKEQIIIDLKHKEIKGTNKKIKKQIEEVLNNDLSFIDHFHLDGFKIVNSLTDDKERAPKNFKPETHKTKKIDILEYLDTIGNKQLYDEYDKALKEYDFLFVKKRFHNEVIKTQAEETKLQEIIDKNAILVEKEKEEKKKESAKRKENRERIKAEKEAKKQAEKEKQLQNS